MLKTLLLTSLFFGIAALATDPLPQTRGHRKLCVQLLEGVYHLRKGLRFRQIDFLSPLEKTLLVNDVSNRATWEARKLKQQISSGNILTIGTDDPTLKSMTLSLGDKGLIEALHKEGGSIYLVKDPKQFQSGGFSLSPNGEPIVYLVNTRESRWLAHELEHFWYWKQKRDRYLRRGFEPVLAARTAYALGNTIGNIRENEHRAVQAEIRNYIRTLGHADPSQMIEVDPVVFLGNAVYPEMSQLININWTAVQLNSRHLRSHDNAELDRLFRKIQQIEKGTLEEMLLIASEAYQGFLYLVASHVERLEEKKRRETISLAEQRDLDVLQERLGYLRSIPLPQLIVLNPKSAYYQGFGDSILMAIEHTWEKENRSAYD